MMNLKRLVCSGAMMLGISTAAVSAQVLVFDFNNEMPGCAMGTSLIAANVSNPVVCRGPGIGSNSAANGFNTNGWDSASEGAAVAANEYISITFTVNSGYNVNITELVANLQRSSTGPQSAGIRSSVDGFTSSLATVTGVPTSAGIRTFDIPDILSATGTIEFRIYAYGGSAAAGTFRLQDSGATSGLSINGTVQQGGGGDPQGACCLADAPYCSFLTQATCLELGGTYQGDNVSCDFAGCPIPVGACCISGICGPGFTAEQCAAESGTWFANMTCEEVTCPQPIGACCVPSQECYVADAFSCISAGGNWAGFGVPCEAITCNPNYGAALVALFDFDANIAGVGNNLTFSYNPAGVFPAGPFTSPGDGYGPLQRNVTPSNPPFTLLDDNLSIFLGDNIGIVNESKLDIWFGINDLLNDDNSSGAATAEWQFNIAGRNNLSISIDLAAMGDFEATGAGGSIADEYTFSVSIDGGSPVAVFSLRCDEAISQSYTLSDGRTIIIDDPMVLNSTSTLENIFRTFTASITGTGSVLALILTATNDSDEGVAFDNIVLLGDSGGPATGGCCVTDGSCTVQSEADCLASGGAYLGNSVACGQAACDAQSVACCLSNACTVTNLGGCLFQGGTVDSFGASCDNADCGPAFCDADWCRDGVVGVPDIFCFLTAWFALDEDARNYGGTVGVPAIFAFLSEWFSTGQGPCVP